MILNETFKHFTFWDAIESGLYFIIVGYYFLIFAYFILMKFRTTKKLYWLFFSLVFIFLAAGRLFFIGLYFFIPENTTMTSAEMAAILMLYYRLATFCTWMATSCLMGMLGILLFPPEAQTEALDKKTIGDAGGEIKLQDKSKLTEQQKIIIRLILIIVPIVIGCLALFLPDNLIMTKDIKEDYNVDIDIIYMGSIEYPLGRALLNFVFMPLLVFIIPFLFFYLGLKTFGVLRQSYWLNCLGFIIYFAGRISQGLLTFIGAEHTAAILSPMLILASLLIIVIANNYEQLK
ncbi:MAG: hypothetical protein ACTSR8_02330 [Promethearchaeota archaeon]